jgi:hypothetical protein
MSLKYRLLFAAASFSIVVAFSALFALPGCQQAAPEKKPDAAAAKPADKAAADKPAADKPAADKAAEPAAAKPEDKPAADKPADPAAKPAEPAGKVGAEVSGMPEVPPVSKFAPAEDLVAQAEQFLKDLEADTADEAAYKEGADKVAKDSNTLVVIALALGLHDQDNKFKANAAAMVKAAQEVAATKDLAGAKKAVAALKDASEGKGQAAGALKWEKVASLAELMKQVPIINTKLKRTIKKFSGKAKENAGATAVLAVIAQGAMADTSPAKNPEQIKQWYDWSAKARDYAGEVNAAIHAGNEAAAGEAMKKMAQNCDDCHAVFHPGT